MIKPVKKNKKIQFLIAILLLLVGACAVTIYLMYNNLYGSGNDMWGHLYKADLLYNEIHQGNLFPLYTKYWYNGIQPFRYWAPLSYYVVAFLEFFTIGNIYLSYCLLAGFSFFVGGLGFIIWGRKINRIPFCTALALLWFFMPESFRVYFCEGNMPRMMSAIVIPYVLYFMYCYLRKHENRALIGILVTMMFMTLSHIMISAMMGVASFLFLLFDCIGKDTKKRSMQILVVMILSYAVCGIYLIPALSGGIVGMDSQTSTELMKSFSKELLLSINPFYRLYGIIDTFYYGLSVVLICITGILLAKKRQKAGFVVTLSILIMTTSSAAAILAKIPMSQLFWMMRFATIAYGFFFFSFIEWTSLKNKFCFIFVAILVVDLIPSMNISKYYTNTQNQCEDAIKTVRSITNQRTTLLDLSGFGSYPSFGICIGDKGVPYSFGWAWQGATTSSNIVMQNTALEAENYLYVFDRALELGNDTVMISKYQVGLNGKTKIDVIAAANKLGYQLYDETHSIYIFKKDTPKNFGVITKYKGLGIGKYATNIEMFYPTFTSSVSYYIDDYTVDELKEYSIIYLSGFEFHNRKTAESMVDELGKCGVKVLIDVSHLPVDKSNNRMHFMDVYAQDITFTDRFPSMYYHESQVKTLDFSDEYTQWNTCYIEGVKNVTGTFYYSNQSLPFIGTNDDKNIVFMGLNLLFHSTETYDLNAFAVISDIIGVGLEELPTRKVVPLQIEYNKNRIVIQSKYDNVNTTLAALDSFQLKTGKVDSRNNLLYVKKGTTEITVEYPQLKKGLLVTLFGIVMIILYLHWVFKRNNISIKK